MLVIHAHVHQHSPLMDQLSAQEQEMLDFEREWWQVGGRKDEEIRVRFRQSPSSYYRALQGLIDRDDAHEYDPLLVKRLRRRRDRRRQVRLVGRRADPGSQ